MIFPYQENISQPGAVKVKKNSKVPFLVTVYLKPLFIMNSKSSFKILIMPCNTPYNALCDPMKNCTHNYNTYLFILTHLESALKHMTNKPSIFMLTIIYEEI